ncbi:alginate export family protein [Allopontixanthobacter sp.]|uniref:alginate export family protein n=1 Tax=Allopontixanthobacter sp. TaxID=2906452 RepID=UPI002ABC2E0B|nr:alginate export family protein [Allopontixanthobacter sp.]MDZ4308789.1 hypothetical protein [Allopontixanthobacter sp.]
MPRFAIALFGCAALALSHQAAFAQAAETIAAPPAPEVPDQDDSWIDPVVDVRYRYEFVDQEDFALDAYASTLRVRLGVLAEPVEMFSLYAEGEAILHVGPDKFNDTANGVVNRPVVGDPEDILLNQIYARFRPHPGASITAGRQTVNYDNQRWIGSVGWRQNDQTLDAVTASIENIPGTGIFASYGHAWRVNRVFGPDSPQGVWRDNDIHLVRIGSEVGAVGRVTAYGYWLDLPAVPALSSRTFGVRLAGRQTLGRSPASATYALEFARQTGAGFNPGDASHSYWLVESGIAFGPANMKLGYERLEGDGRTALQTPLATLHAFNGWADKFLVTPQAGLRDLYVDAGYAVPADKGFLSGTVFRFVFHDFRSTEGNIHYGREWDAMLSRKLYGPVSVTLKLAHYDAIAFASKTTKGWIQLEARF